MARSESVINAKAVAATKQRSSPHSFQVTCLCLDITGIEPCRHRRDALTLAGQQQTLAIILNRCVSVFVPRAGRQALHICREALLLWAWRGESRAHKNNSTSGCYVCAPVVLGVARCAPYSELSAIRRILLAYGYANLLQFEPDGRYRVTAGPEMLAREVALLARSAGRWRSSLSETRSRTQPDVWGESRRTCAHGPAQGDLQ